MCCHHTHLSGVNVRAPAVHVEVVHEDEAYGRTCGLRDALAGVPGLDDMIDLTVLIELTEADCLRPGEEEEGGNSIRQDLITDIMWEAWGMGMTHLSYGQVAALRVDDPLVRVGELEAGAGASAQSA